MAGNQAGVPGPVIELRQVSVERHELMNYWNVRWRVSNNGTDPLKVIAVRLPHGQFKSDEHRFDAALDLFPQESGQFQLAVRCAEPPGLVTENAFVIFSIIRLGEAWRIFVRIRVVVSPEGKPQTATELITTQKVGFSGLAS